MVIVWKMTLHLFAVFVILKHIFAFNEVNGCYQDRMEDGRIRA